MKKVGFALIVLLVLGGVAAWFWPSRSGPATLRLPGTVEVQEVRLGSRVGGRIAAVHVREGQIVEANTLLVSFESPELTARRDQAKAKLTAAQALFEKANRGPLEEEIAEAKGAADAARYRYERMKAGFRDEQKRHARHELETAQAEQKQAEDDFKRISELAGLSAQERESVFNTRSRAQARVKTAQANLDMMLQGSRSEEIAETQAEFDRWQARYQLLRRGTREEDKSVAYAAVAEAQAILTAAEADLREASVLAPERCAIEVVAVRAGDLVAPGQAVIRALRVEDLWVKVFVPATELGKLREGQDVEVAVDSHPGQRFTGQVIHIANTSEFTPRNVQSLDERRHQVFAVKVRVTDPSGVFKSGMASEVFLPLQRD